MIYNWKYFFLFIVERDLRVGIEVEVLQFTVQVVMVTVPDFFSSQSLA
jgi:hypothetical protein